MYPSKDLPKKFKAGEIIMRQGEYGQNAYIIETGKVEIAITGADGEERIVGTRGPGAVIGEMSLIDNAPRTASIKAVEDCEMLKITKDDFSRRLEHADPVLRMATQVILTRYRDTLSRTDINSHNNEISGAENVERLYVEQTDVVDKIRIANEFKEALDSDKIKLFYQPVINLQTGEISGFEALMRWIHPEKGFIPPDVFIPVIEQDGQILQASNWAFRQACNDLKHIQESTRYHKKLHMSINFSSEDFSSPDFIDNIYNALSETDVQASQIHLEITERLLMAQPETARKTLEMCRKAGMGIAIDDFGTGYSSLSYLHAFPINTLKIDQSFVRDMEKNTNSMELVRSIITLGQNLNMSIIAEGVENLKEAILLKSMGCHYAQGYYFARPVPKEEVIAIVSDWKNAEI